MKRSMIQCPCGLWMPEPTPEYETKDDRMVVRFVTKRCSDGPCLMEGVVSAYAKAYRILYDRLRGASET